MTTLSDDNNKRKVVMVSYVGIIGHGATYHEEVVDHGTGDFIGINLISAVGLPIRCRCDWCKSILIRISSRTSLPVHIGLEDRLARARLEARIIFADEITSRYGRLTPHDEPGGGEEEPIWCHPDELRAMAEQLDTEEDGEVVLARRLAQIDAEKRLEILKEVKGELRGEFITYPDGQEKAAFWDDVAACMDRLIEDTEVANVVMVPVEFREGFAQDIVDGVMTTPLVDQGAP